MSQEVNKTEQGSNEVDYFLVLLKNWKTILLSFTIFFVIGICVTIFIPQTFTSTSTFSVALEDELKTDFGVYKLKTTHPSHYLATLELNSFKDSVLEDRDDVSSLQKVSFQIEEDKNSVSSANKDQVIPNKFDFTVSGPSKEELTQINNKALHFFLAEMDKNFQEDMFHQFSSELKTKIDHLQFAIDIKNKLITDLKESLDKEEGIQVKTDKNDLKELIDDRLINSLDGSHRGLIISMMLSGSQGNRYYQETVLAVEEVELKILRNDLEKEKALLESLMENKENGTLSNLFAIPFSSSYFLLTSPEVKNISKLDHHLKQVLIFAFIGFFISTGVVLIRAYYNLNS